jgi:tyrosyl-tRNA synthetase
MGNAVWLNAEMTSCYNLYQYFLNTSDADVERHVAFSTFKMDVAPPFSDCRLLHSPNYM